MIFDTEYTAWEGSQQRAWSNSGEHREIIQIAAVKVDLGKKEPYVDTFNLLVRPRINPQLSDYIVNLTGISQSRIDWDGYQFEQAIEMLYAFSDFGTLPLFSYGCDAEVILENASLYRTALPEFTAGIFDTIPLFQSEGIDTEANVSGTLHKSVGIELDGAAHDALHDARSVALTLRALLRN